MNTLLITLASDTLTVPLQLTESARKSDLPPGPKSREKRKQVSKLHKKGLTIGEAVLSLKLN
jgi:hypothetical protein